MASVSVPGMSGWGNGLPRCQAPLHPLRLMGRCQGAFVCWAGPPPGSTQVRSPRGCCERVEVSTSASGGDLLRPCYPPSAIDDRTVLSPRDTTPHDTEPALPPAKEGEQRARW